MKISHEKARNILLYSRPIKNKQKIFDYISQQEKVTELLGLYREKSDFLAHIMNGNKGLQENYMKLLGTIEQLEKELEEMK